jgi:ABC-type transport system substrate-binding protein
MEVAVYVDSLRRAGFDVSQLIVPVQQIRDPQVRSLLGGMQVRGGGDGVIRYTTDQIPRPENRWHGDNRGGWSNAEYDRLFKVYASTLDASERVRQLAQLERILSDDAAIIPHMFNVDSVPYVAALQGPVARHTPGAGYSFLHVQQWEWLS